MWDEEHKGVRDVSISRRNRGENKVQEEVARDNH